VFIGTLIVMEFLSDLVLDFKVIVVEPLAEISLYLGFTENFGQCIMIVRSGKHSLVLKHNVS